MGEPRYRVENGEAIVDVRVASVEQLFDNRDPAPFRRRDLDPALIEYLVAAAHDVVGTGKIRLRCWVERPCDPPEVENGVRSHFEYELDRGERRRREQVRVGWVGLALAAVVVVALIGTSQLVARVVGGALGAGLSEALVISGWVVMWRPVELLIHDGIPWRRERRALRMLRDAAVDIHVGGR
ncbi:MAG TPA: hypothetical protein VHE35_25735 [Kofleriaceae bacterium]|nr:hypothetical protein [Kofleriaceae bacterium]